MSSPTVDLQDNPYPHRTGPFHWFWAKYSIAGADKYQDKPGSACGYGVAVYAG